MDVSVMGCSKITFVKLKDHPNDGIWLELEGAQPNERIWVTVWIPVELIINNLDTLADELRAAVLNNTSMKYTISAPSKEPVVNAASTEAKTD